MAQPKADTFHARWAHNYAFEHSHCERALSSLEQGESFLSLTAVVENSLTLAPSLATVRGKKFTIATTNQSINEEDRDSLLVDSGFSGLAVVGYDTLYRMLGRKLLKVLPATCTPVNSYTFGAGPSTRSVERHKLDIQRIGHLYVDVVPGALPFLLGRQLLKRKVLIPDFAQDILISGRGTPGEVISSPAHVMRLRPLDSLASAAEVRLTPSVDALEVLVETTTAAEATSAHVGAGTSASTELMPVEVRKHRARGGKQRVWTSTLDDEVLEREEIEQNKAKTKLTESYKRCTNPQCDEDGCWDFNVYTALKKSPDRELEEALIKELLSEELPAHSPPQEDSLAPLRERTGSARVLSKQVSDRLNASYPSPAWGIRAGFIRRLHLLRHAPAEKIREFIYAALPLKAKSRDAKACKQFCDMVKAVAEKVIAQCIGCQCNSKKIRRPIGMSVVAPFAIGMVDTMCLNYDEKWYALVVADIGSGVSWAFPIRERFPPDGNAVFSTYVTRWASLWGPHGKVVADRESIFANPSAIALWESLGITRETVASYAHFSMGGVERKIGVLRYSIDRIRDSGAAPNSIDGWEVCLAVVCNALFNDVDFSGTVPSVRVTGRMTSLLRNALTDTMTSSNEDVPALLEQAEHAQEVYTHARADRRLRNLMHSHLPPGAGAPPYPSGTLVYYYIDNGDGTRAAGRHGPAEVVCLDEDNRYVLRHTGKNLTYADRQHVVPKIEVDETERSLQDEKGEKAAEVKSELKGEAIAVKPKLEPGLGAIEDEEATALEPTGDFEIDQLAKLIHNPDNEKPDQVKITCPKCRNPGSHHGHMRMKGTDDRDPRCRLYWRDREKDRSVREAKQIVKVVYASRYARFPTEDREGAEPEFVSTVTARGKRPDFVSDAASTVASASDLGVITAADLENASIDDLGYIHDVAESTYFYEVMSAADDPIVDQTESKYLYTWDDLTPEAQKLAMKKALLAYDNHQSWDRKQPWTEDQVKAFRRQHPDTVLLDSILVKDAKIKEKELIGKVRLTPRGFRDNSDKARFFSTSPTAASASVRLSELLGMRYGLRSWLFDVTDAFFIGELLRPDEYIFLKVPKEVDPAQPWYRLRREVPGCRGASSSWYRTLTKKLISWGWELCTTDKALFVKREKGKLVGILPVHVDDGKLRATEACANELIKQFREAGVVLGTVEKQEIGAKVEFTGLQFIERPEGEEINQDIYVQNKLKSIDAEVKSIAKSADDNAALEPALSKLYGTCIGRLIWLMPTQVRHSYEISLLSRYRSCPRNKHLKRLGKLITAIKAEPGRIFLPRFNAKLPLKVVAVVDAGEGEVPDDPIKLRDHQCVIILLAQPDGMTEKAAAKAGTSAEDTSFRPGVPMKVGIVAMSSVGIARVTHSSFDSETLVAVSAIDLLSNIREVGGEIDFGLCPPRLSPERPLWSGKLWGIELHSDSMSMCKVVRLGVGASLNRRRQRDVEDLRQFVLEDGAALLHIDGPTNPADVGTKPAARTEKSAVVLAKLLRDGKYQAQISKNFKETFVTTSSELFTVDNGKELHTVFQTILFKEEAPALERIRLRLLFS